MQQKEYARRSWKLLGTLKRIEPFGHTISCAKKAEYFLDYLILSRGNGKERREQRFWEDKYGE